MQKAVKNDNELLEIFSDRIRILRKEKKYKLKKVSEILLEEYNLQMDYSNISNYERGTKTPQIYVLSAFADMYNVSVDWLLGKTDERSAKVLQTSLFDSEGVEHDIEVSVDKDSDLAKMPVGDVIELIRKIKDLGLDFNNIK